MKHSIEEDTWVPSYLVQPFQKFCDKNKRKAQLQKQLQKQLRKQERQRLGKDSVSFGRAYNLRFTYGQPPSDIGDAKKFTTEGPLSTKASSKAFSKALSKASRKPSSKPYDVSKMFYLSYFDDKKLSSKELSKPPSSEGSAIARGAWPGDTLAAYDSDSDSDKGSD